MSTNKHELTALTSYQFVKRLPADVWTLVLRYLTLAEIARCRLTCVSVYNHKTFISVQNQALKTPQIHTTEFRTYFIDALGRIFESGGVDYRPINKPVQIAGLKDKRVSQVLQTHTLDTVVLTRDGAVFEVNRGGTSKINEFTNKTVIQMVKLISEYLFLTNEGEIYSTRSRSMQNTSLIFSSGENKILEMTTGEDLYVYFLAKNGDVYSMGRNSRGQLGLGDTEDRDIPVKMMALQGKGIIQIVTSGMGSYFRTKNGKVYSFGDNSSGGLALGDTRNRMLPELVTALDHKNVVNMVAGMHHVIFQTQEGHIYGAGGNEAGQLGLEDLNDRSTPEFIIVLQNKNIVKMVAGESQTFFLTDTGEVYRAGRYSDNGFELFVPDQPEKITALNEKHVVDVVPGSEHTVFLTNEGEFFTRGINLRGQLGLGDYISRSEPTRINELQFKPIKSAHSLPSITVQSLHKILKTYHQNKGFFRKYFSFFIPSRTKTIAALEALT